MSAEALLGEATALLGSRLVIKAGDQAYFCGKQVYTNVSTCGKSAGEAAANKTCASKTARDAVVEAITVVKKALGGEGSAVVAGTTDKKVFDEIAALKKENAAIKEDLAELRKLVKSLTVGEAKPAAAAPAPAAEAAKDDDFDLFDSEEEEEDEEKAKLVAERLKAYQAKKSAKPGPIAKSSVILDVKPWDDETDLGEMEKLVRSIEMDGLVWGGAKLIAIGYGIKKLQIISVIEDLKVSVDDLIEKITGDFESHVQSVDIVAFNKI